MAEYLLKRLCQTQWQLRIYFTGGTRAQMQAWLRSELMYRDQPKGDLGDGLWHAFQQGFSAGCDHILAIGADCPDLSCRHIKQAFQQLTHADVVLGHAQDGGYHLVGLRRWQLSQVGISPSSLFTGIDWSTSRVLQQTQLKAQHLGLAVTQLETLSDIDRPQDLAIWEQIYAAAQQQNPLQAMSCNPALLNRS